MYISTEQAYSIINLKFYKKYLNIEFYSRDKCMAVPHTSSLVGQQEKHLIYLDNG